MIETTPVSPIIFVEKEAYIAFLYAIPVTGSMWKAIVTFLAVLCSLLISTNKAYFIMQVMIGSSLKFDPKS